MISFQYGTGAWSMVVQAIIRGVFKANGLLTPRWGFHSIVFSVFQVNHTIITRNIQTNTQKQQNIPNEGGGH